MSKNKKMLQIKKFLILFHLKLLCFNGLTFQIRNTSIKDIRALVPSFAIGHVMYLSLNKGHLKMRLDFFAHSPARSVFVHHLQHLFVEHLRSKICTSTFLNSAFTLPDTGHE